jgi:hypothetical protein
LIVDADNCSVHRSVTESFTKKWGVISMPHPPYSPDPAPSDFYFFPTVKERLEQSGITDEDQLFKELHTILTSIPGEEMERAFEAWRERGQNVNQGDRGHIDQ